MFREWKTSCSRQKKNNRHLRERFVNGKQPKCKLAIEASGCGHGETKGPQMQLRPSLPNRAQASLKRRRHSQYSGNSQGAIEDVGEKKGSCHLPQLLKRTSFAGHQHSHPHHSNYLPPLPVPTAATSTSAICNSCPMMSTYLFSLFAKTITLLTLFCLLLSSATCQERSSSSTKTLYIAGFFPTSRDKLEGAIGRGVLPAVKLALQHVNESPLFTKYRLDLVWNNTKVRSKKSVGFCLILCRV